MENIGDLYVLGEPIKTDIGDLHFISVNEYTKFARYIPFLNLEKREVVNYIYFKDKAFAKELNKLYFIEMIKDLNSILNLQEFYKEMFEFCFKEDVFYKIKNEKEFEYYRELIRKINFIKNRKVNSNPELAKFDMYEEMLAEKNGEIITFESIYTSVWLYTGIEPRNITLYQLYALFNRIGMFKNYDTTTLYSSVSPECKVETWYKHIDILHENEKNHLKLGDLNKLQKNILKV